MCTLMGASCESMFDPWRGHCVYMREYYSDKKCELARNLL